MDRGKITATGLGRGTAMSFLGSYLARGFISILCVFAMAMPAAFALTVQQRGFSELVDRADTIVVGTVAGLRTEWSADGQTIYTFVSLTDLDVLKGDVPAATYELRMPGGVIGERAQVYPGMPNLEQGQRYVLFIRGELRDFFPLVGVYQGLYRVIEDKDKQQRVMRFDQHPEDVVSGVTVEMPTLDEFTARIRNQLSAHPQENPP